MMSPTLSHALSFTLHLALLFFLVNSTTEMKPLDDGQGLFIELQEGQTPLGETPVPTKKVEPIELPPKPKKVVQKKVEKPKPLPKKEVVQLPVKEKKIKTPAKQEEQPKEVITKLPEKAQPAQEVVIQEDESFAKVVVPEEPKPVNNISTEKQEQKPVAAATTASGDETQSENSIATTATTALPQKTETAKPSKLMANESKNNVDTYGAPSGIRDARKLAQRPGNRQPEYPVNDRLNRRQGRVVLLAYVTSDGRIQDVKVEKAQATNAMTREAVSAFSRYRYRKGQQGWVRMPFEFQLVGSAKNMAARLRRSKRR